ncbi:MAG TPA: SDR family oxidoreductase [Longimicrobium sp.]|jgi:short-subunit dehydrogenase|uniref:SDR family oxidoreductase n=1 Tax=Longimicrobium sp. TaxID=2029185 RepID=UPI002EDB6301
MEIQLKPVREQVIVITGASSGIGLATARKAAKRGARVVLAARDEQALRRITAEISGAGGNAVYCVADTASEDDVRRVAETALREYGTIDTWVNNAGVSIYGMLEETPLQDARRLFDVNYWGMVNGAMTALPVLRRGGGALINVGSIVSDRAVPMQGHYSASKHAVKAFSDALRVELEHDGVPVAVTVIKPGSIDTPFPQHARNLMEHEPTLPAPVYRPETVADAILFCAAHPRKSVTVGGGGRMNAMMGILVPGAADKAMQGMVEQQQKEERTRPGRRDTLYQPPLDNGETRGDYEGRVMRTSAYTKAVMHPGAAALALGVVAGLGVVLAGAAGLLGGRGDAEDEVFELEEEEFAAAAHVEPGDEVGVYAGELEMASDDYAERGVETLPGGDYGFRAGADQAY